MPKITVRLFLKKGGRTTGRTLVRLFFKKKQSYFHIITGVTCIIGILVSINPPIQQTIQTKNRMFVRNLVTFFDIIYTTQQIGVLICFIKIIK